MTHQNACDAGDLVYAYAMQALPATEAAAVESHVSTCALCQEELKTLRPVIDAFLSVWPADVLRPPPVLQTRLARRIAAKTGAQPVLLEPTPWVEPDWDEVSPGLFCKLLATDTERQRVSMLVRMAPGVEYPPHTHADVEELHLLDGELWIDDKKLYPGDYNRAEPGTSDSHVWTETGCTCVLITSTQDALR